MANFQRQPIAIVALESALAVQPADQAAASVKQVRQIGEALAKLGWQVDLFTAKEHADAPKVELHTPHCRTIRLEAGAAGSPQQFLEHLPKFVQVFQKFQTKEGTNYPLVHTHGWLAGGVGLQLKERSGLQLVHTDFSADGSGRSDELQSLLDWQLWQQADQIVVTQPHAQDARRFLRGGKGQLPFSRLHGVEMIAYDPAVDSVAPAQSQSRVQLGLDAESPVLLYVGALSPDSGVDTLLTAFLQVVQQMPTTTLMLVSDDRTRQPQVERQVAALGLSAQVKVVAGVSADRLPLYYAAASACVIPSHHEPFGQRAIEALTYRTPVVASDVSGLRFTVIEGETGLRVPPGNAKALAQAIVHMVADPIWAQRFAVEQPDRLPLNCIQVAAQLSDLYRRLLVQALTHQPVLDLRKRATIEMPMAPASRAVKTLINAS